MEKRNISTPCTTVTLVMNRQFEVVIVLGKVSRHSKFQVAMRLHMLQFRSRYNCDMTQGREDVYREELCHCKSIILGSHMGNISLGQFGKLWETKGLSRYLVKSLHVIHYWAYYTCTITQIAILPQ